MSGCPPISNLGKRIQERRGLSDFLKCHGLSKAFQEPARLILACNWMCAEGSWMQDRSFPQSDADSASTSINVAVLLRYQNVVLFPWIVMLELHFKKPKVHS